MRVVETLPGKMTAENCRRVTSLVDFAGSTSKDLCDSKIRSLGGPSGTVYHAADFDQDLRGTPEYNAEFKDYLARHKGEFEERAKAPEATKTLDILAKEGFAIKNSQWNSYWRGKVAGGLCMALTMSPGKEVTDKELESLNIGKLQKGSSTLRAVIAVMIDGGPITQQEHREMPQICDDVVFDLRRQGYDWASNAHVLLVRFPDVEKMLQSLDGEPNLSRSEHLKRKQNDEFLLYGRKNLAWQFEGSPMEKSNNGVSFFEEEKNWKAALDYDEISPVNLYQSVADGDLDGTKKLITKGIPIEKAEFDGKTALHACASQGDPEIMQVLLGGFKVEDKKKRRGARVQAVRE